MLKPVAYIKKVNKSIPDDEDVNDKSPKKNGLSKTRQASKSKIYIESSDSESSDDEVVELPKRQLRKRKTVENHKEPPSRSKSRKTKRILIESSSEYEDSEDSDSNDTGVKQKKEKRKKKNTRNSTGRRKIKKILDEDDLLEQTKEAAKEEQERLKRLEEKQKSHPGETEEADITDKTNSTSNVILQKNPLVTVTPYIAQHLRPHQIEGIKFIWDNLVESTERAKVDAGGGCILAHCMGLGKTLQTIASVHTFVKCKHLKFKTVLVVAPLNTVRNWVSEFVQWCEDGDELQLYNLAECRSNKERITMLREWQNIGGVLIIGYDMYRIMATKTKYKAWKTTVQECLIDPGPDIVVCDEGHMLKNADSHISLKLSTIKTRRRLVLTGTPLQNNLIEYHCMVNFVKPDLLGSLKEFRNRFVNPIINGQHTDSTDADVNIMKKRSHVLHQMLQGFVQRKDYSALKSYLSAKYEYVLKVRLTPLQIRIYQHYLNTKTNRGTDSSIVNSYGKGASLFSDYQNLMRVWTHPKSLLLHTVKKEKREEREAERNFITDEEEEMTGSDTDRDWLATSSEDESSSKKETRNHVDKKSNSDSDSSIGKKTAKKKKISKNSSEEEADESNSDESSEEQSEEEHLPHRKTRKHKRGENKRYRLRGEEASSEEEQMESVELGKKKEEWYSSLLPEDKTELNNFENSSKITVLFEILKLAQELREKVLVFSQSLVSLDLIEEMLYSISKSPENVEKESHGLNSTPTKHNSWFRNIDYFRMDGSTLGHHRHRWINAFNDEQDHRARLFLISTKAGSLGVNLVGANRVVIFDASWNPTHDTQSMFRVYRFGQTKKCYIYRLIAEGTMEEKIYQRQVNKQSLSIRVVDEQQINRYFTASSLAEMYAFEPTTPESDKDKPVPVVPKDHILAEILLDPRTRHLIASYHEHDSLLDHQVDEELTEEERKSAWEEYELEKKGGYSTTIPNPAHRIQQIASNSYSTTFSTAPQLNNQKCSSLQDAMLIMSHLNTMMQDAYMKVRAHESKPIEDIVSQLENTPMYSTTSRDTLVAIAKEVNYRLSLKRTAAQRQFIELQKQHKILHKQYFESVGAMPSAGTSPEEAPSMTKMFQTVQLPSREALLQQMSSIPSQSNAQQALQSSSTVQSSTKIEVIELSDTETGTSSQS